MILETIIEQSIDDLDFEVPCDRCQGTVCHQPGTRIVTWVGTCSHHGQRWLFSEKCATREPPAGNCYVHGEYGHYEVLS